MLVLLLAFVVTVFGDFATDILRVVTEIGFTDFINATVIGIVEGNFNSTAFTSQLNALISALQEKISSVEIPFGGATLSYVIVMLVYVVYRLFVSYTDVTAACQVAEFMDSNASRPFVWYLFKKQGRTWQFSCLQLLIAMPLDILIVSGALGIYLLFLIAFGWWTIIPVVVLMVVLYAVRHTLCAFCLPAVACEDMPAHKAFRQGLSQVILRFWRVFWKTFTVVCVMVVISVLSIMFVDNRIALTVLITVPNFVLFFYLKCINMVEYFEANDRPYFSKRMVIEGTDRYNRRQKRLEKKRKPKEM